VDIAIDRDEDDFFLKDIDWSLLCFTGETEVARVVDAEVVIKVGLKEEYLGRVDVSQDPVTTNS
jgi:hypothetical protein